MLKTTSSVINASQIATPITLPGNVTLSTGNLVIGTAGKGIDFSADPSAPGMTSELLDDYEEGTWTPTDISGAFLTLTQNAQATYVKVGTQVTCTMDVSYPATADASFANISLPFSTVSGASFVGQIGYQTFGSYLSPSGSTFGFNFWDALGSAKNNASLSGVRFQITFSYRSA